MLLECPNCREPVSFFRSVRTGAWGSFRCRACGSVLSVSLARRLLAAGSWLIGLIVAGEILHIYAWGRIVAYAGMIVTLLGMLYLSEKVVLLERRAFTCRKCGYDLQGLTEDRCPECGAAFDRSERERILARIAAPPGRPRYRWIPVLVLLLIAFCLAAGGVAWRRASARKARPAATPTTLPNATATQSGT